MQNANFTIKGILMIKKISALLLTFLCFESTQVHAATLVVGPPPASIQTVINAANNGDTVQLSAGIYTEQIQIINKSINLIGTGQATSTILAPPPSIPLTQYYSVSPTIRIWPVVMIDNQAIPTTQTVNISDLTVDGGTQQQTGLLPPPAASSQYSSSDRYFGIGYNNASGTIQNVRTTNTNNLVSPGQIAGGGIVNISTGIATVFNVTNCLVDNYQRNGIVCQGSLLTANVSNCMVNRAYVYPVGTPAASPNGITYGGSALGSVINNTVQNNISSVLPPNSSSTGINISGAGANFIVSGNAATNNDIGISAVGNGNNIIIQNNNVVFNTTPGSNISEGIIVGNTAGLSTITSNTMNVLNFNMELVTNNGTNQIFNLSNNQFNGSQTGLYIAGNGVAGPIVNMDSDSFVGTAGYYIQEVAAPNDVWPTTATVSFDGLVSGHITMAEYLQIRTQIYDQVNDPTLGLVLDYIIPLPPTLTLVASDFGPVTGGNTVTITGTNFLSSNTLVYFGANLGTNIVVVDDNTITVTVPAGALGPVVVTVQTPFGITPVVPESEYTYINAAPAPLPPSNFVGVIKKNKLLNKTQRYVKATWTASPSPTVVLYRIYQANGVLVDDVSATSPFVFVACYRNTGFYIVAVDAQGFESTPVNLVITQS